jgi:uncharacterized protein DUF3667
VSHLKEREEKICLNCNASLYGRYCHICGQENLEPKETVWHLVNHFFQDVTHFDGKFFSTVKYLITKPGFLSREYMLGRRASYLNPIRMYVFTSAIFFVILFSLTNADKIMKLDEKPEKEKAAGIKDWEKEKTKLQNELKTQQKDKDEDSTETINNIKELDEEIAAAKKIYGDTTTRKFDTKDIALLMVRANMDSLRIGGMPDSIASKLNKALAKRDSSKKDDDGLNLFGFSANKYATPQAYDSAQNKLPESRRDGWFKTLVKRKLVAINYENHKDKRSYFEHVRENFLHSFPKILFISLPFFALILKLVYVRRKQFYYTSHGIFAIHLYCATFILMLVLILSNDLHDAVSWKWLHVLLDIINFAIWIYMLIYLYKAMRKFYGQGRFKTFFKYVIICFLAFMVNLFLMLLFILISAISI